MRGELLALVEAFRARVARELALARVAVAVAEQAAGSWKRCGLCTNAIICSTFLKVAYDMTKKLSRGGMIGIEP